MPTQGFTSSSITRIPEPPLDGKIDKDYINTMIKAIRTNLQTYTTRFKNLVFSKYFESDPLAISHPVTLSVEHGFREMPKLRHTILVNISTELGYALGTEVDIGLFVGGDAITLDVWISGAIQIPDLGSGYALTDIDETKWKLVLKCMA